MDALVVPVSGGGMISGIAIAAKHLQPGIKIYAAEPVGTHLAEQFLSQKCWRFAEFATPGTCISDLMVL